MGAFQETNLWQATLADQGPGDSYDDSRELLRTAYLQMRERAGELAAEIAIAFPELTDHGINHLDALWEHADLIAGDDYKMNPAEAFVFGGAVLLHDLGLAIAAYPGGRRDLEAGDDWVDAIALVLGEQLGRPATDDEIGSASHEIKSKALKTVLRKKHAEQAERLGLISWKNKKGDQLFLLDSADLRSAFGSTMGLVGRSHWSSVGDLLRDFPADLTAPVLLPGDWTVDQVAIACLLRAADASHLDKRRAPELARLTRSLGSEAEIHWGAQAKIHKPQVKGDRLQYTSGESFRRDEAQAWWLCLSLLKNADRELREVDGLLQDSGRQRFRVVGVRGVDDPERMATYLRTEGWIPVDAVVHISDVNRIVEHLGGEQLYGRVSSVGLRELIQNGIDAIRARRKLERRGDDWGKITVEVGGDEERQWIEVTDTGTGMSPRVLTGVLLDFGESLWRSTEVSWELPGLAGSGFQPIGKFGIGFFSVFMLGEKVKVVSRRFDRGHLDTHVLEFSSGIDERPLMRRAEAEERLNEGGTKIRVWLRTKVEEQGGILARWGENPPMTPVELCQHLAPASPVDVEVRRGDEFDLAVEANDWRSLEPATLLRRLASEESKLDEDLLAKTAARLRDLKLEDGTIVGRACIGPLERGEVGRGAVVVGGLRATSLGPLCGLLVGDVLVAARNYARPIVPAEILADWASEQSRLGNRVGAGEDPEDEDYADVIARCGGDSGVHSIAVSRLGPLSFDETVAWIAERKEFYAIGKYEFRRDGNDSEVQLDEDVLAVQNGYMGIISGPGPIVEEWPESLFPERKQFRGLGCDWKVVKACCRAWACQPDEIEVTHDEGDWGTFRGGPMHSTSLTRIRRSASAIEQSGN